MGFIDEKRTVSEFPVKPRRMKGTPAGIYRTKVCGLILTTFALVGFAYSRLDSSQSIIKYWNDNFPVKTEEERNLMLPIVGPIMPKEGVQAILEAKGIFFEDVDEGTTKK